MPTYSQPYNDIDYAPAMPVVELGLLSPAGEDAQTQVMAIVDTGSDVSILPIDVLTEARALFVRSRRLRGIPGSTIAVDTYLVTVKLGQHVMPGIMAVAMPARSEAVIGRDVLNQLDLRLIGPAHELWIE
jgi:hypothetical protein